MDDFVSRTDTYKGPAAGRTTQLPTRDPGTSCWCLKCGTYLFTVPNAWKSVSTKAVIHASPNYRNSDIHDNMRQSEEESDGAGFLMGCSLKHLQCKGLATAPCDNKLGLYCVRATNKKRYKGHCFLHYKNLVLRRGKNYPVEKFQILGDFPSPHDENENLQEPQNAVGSSLELQTVEPDRNSEQRRESIQVRSSPPVASHSITERSPDGQAVTGSFGRKQHRDGNARVPNSQANRQSGLESITLASGTLRPTTHQSFGTLHPSLEDMSDDDGEDYATGMIEIPSMNAQRNERSAASISRPDSAAHVNDCKHGPEIARLRRDLDDQNKDHVALVSTVKSQEETINVLFARIDRLEAQLKAKTRETAAVPSAAKADLPATNPIARIQGSKESSASERGLSPFVSAAHPSAKAASSPGPESQDMQATMAYLKRTVRDDDSDDEDFNPSQGASELETQAWAKKNHKKHARSPMRALQRSPFRVGRPRLNSLASLRRIPSPEAHLYTEESPGISILDETPSGRPGGLIHRGISGRSKRVPTHMSHSAFAASTSAGRGIQSSTPSTYEPQPKKQRIDLGSGSFKGNKPGSAKIAAVVQRRDSEGYLLRENGQRDKRSIRGRALGSAVFQPTAGERRTVASLGLDNTSPVGQMTIMSTPTPAAPARSLNAPPPVLGSPAAATAGKQNVPASDSATNAGSTAQQHSDKMAIDAGNNMTSPDIGEEAIRIAQQRLQAGINKPRPDGTQYSSKHAEFMSKLRL